MTKRNKARPRGRLLDVVESTATLERTSRIVSEVSAAAVVGPEGVNSKMTVAYIKAGWSKNGRYYPAAVLQEAVKVAVSGTQLFIDHATDAEDMARPANSVRNLAAVQSGPARWNESTQTIEADVSIFPGWRTDLAAMRESIGLSVRAWVYAEAGTVDGVTGDIVSSIEGFKSVDFVTQPAAGGRIISVYESIQDGKTADEARNTGAWLESRLHMEFTRTADYMYGDGYLNRAERIILSSAIGEALNAFTKVVESQAPQLYARDPYCFPEPVEIQADESGKATRPAVAPKEVKAMPKENEDASKVSEAEANARAAVAEAESDRLSASVQQANEARHQAAEAKAAQLAAEAKLQRFVGESAAVEESSRQVHAMTGVPAGVQGLLLPRVTASAKSQVTFHTEGASVGQVNAEGLKLAVTAAIEAEKTYAAAILEAHGVGKVSGAGGKETDANEADAKAADDGMFSLFAESGMNPDAAKLAVQGR